MLFFVSIISFFPKDSKLQVNRSVWRTVFVYSVLCVACLFLVFWFWGPCFRCVGSVYILSFALCYSWRAFASWFQCWRSSREFSRELFTFRCDCCALAAYVHLCVGVSAWRCVHCISHGQRLYRFSFPRNLAYFMFYAKAVVTWCPTVQVIVHPIFPFGEVLGILWKIMSHTGFAWCALRVRHDTRDSVCPVDWSRRGSKVGGAKICRLYLIDFLS